jgi:hypothetical protein
MALRRKTIAAVCVLAVAATGALAGCGGKAGDKKNPIREGIAFPLEGVDYNVFITRELNLKIPPDSAYYKGPEAPKGQTLYGVFLQVCNNGKKAMQTAGRFKIVDNQGNEFSPTDLPTDNAFAYHPELLAPKECIPQAGSVAQLGPTAGSMLLFQLPLLNTENRPLDLEIEGPHLTLTGKPQRRSVELDL